MGEGIFKFKVEAKKARHKPTTKRPLMDKLLNKPKQQKDATANSLQVSGSLNPHHPNNPSPIPTRPLSPNSLLSPPAATTGSNTTTRTTSPFAPTTAHSDCMNVVSSR